MRFPERFAAAIPMAGGANPAYAFRFSAVPVWDFHGTVDQLVSVMYSRERMDSLLTLGRSVVYAHCHNLDCHGMPDSVIAMNVAIHEDLFYTEIANTGHTYGIWGTTSNHPFLAPWVFDKYKKQPASIALTILQSYTTQSGSTPVKKHTSLCCPCMAGLLLVVHCSPKHNIHASVEACRFKHTVSLSTGKRGGVRACPPCFISRRG